MLEPRCRVCMSKHRAYYERLKLEEKKTYKELSKLSAELESRPITEPSFCRHFKRHVEGVLERELEARKDRLRELERRDRETLDIVEDLKRYLRILGNIVQSFLDKKEKLSLKEVHALNAVIKNIRETSTTLANLTGRLRISTKSEDEIKLFKKAIDRISPQAAEEILRAMDSVGLVDERAKGGTVTKEL